jgi:hypothetical protein
MGRTDLRIPLRWTARSGALAHTARLGALVLCLTASATAQAHDTWFAVRGATLPGNAILALGTGNQFPVQESPIAAEHLQAHGCRQGARELALTAAASTKTALLLRAQPSGKQPVTCWAQLVPFEIHIEDDKVALYFDEINASPALRQTWATMQARGLKWTERYVKNARVEIAGSEATTAAAAPAVPMGMDIVLESGLQPTRPGDTLAFRVLRDGGPLADFAIELRGEQPTQARWLRTDQSGRVVVQVPTPGAWVLRGTDLRLSTSDPTVWESRFVTLAFTVGAVR